MKSLLALLILIASPSFAQYEHMAMHRAKVNLATRDDSSAHVLTVRLGPMNLPAHSDHMAIAQPEDVLFAIPFEGWVLAYHPRLSDQTGTTLPGSLLHHVAFWNTRRSDFLCPNFQEHIFGAGSEMADWQALPGFGYRVHPGDRIRVSSMFYNPTSTDYRQTYLEVKLDYQLASSAQLKNVYPAWFDVQQCRRMSDYDLKAGNNVTSGTLKLAYAGKLLGVGGHMHNYGRELLFQNVTRHEEIAKLDAKSGDQGRLLSIPIVLFLDRGGYHLDKGDEVRVTATYENASGHDLPRGAMGIVVGYFLPDSDAEMWKTLVRTGKEVTGASDAMPNMAH